jgi:hypothetical protein
MRFYGSIVGVGMAMGLVAGCSSAHEMLDDAGSTGGDTGHEVYDVGPPVDAATEACGPTICGPGTQCCNASCGICTEPGIGCVDIACADAGPAPRFCGGLAGVRCETNEYCDYPDGSYCGGDDSQGVCRPRPTDCPDPGGVPVCGCDGTDYLTECSAYLVGTDIAHFGSCTTPPPSSSVSATRSCGPTDGPAWLFVVTDGGAPVCSGIPTTASLSLTVFDGLESAAPGTVYAIGSVPSSQGQAEYCPAGGGGPPCFTLSGTVTLDSFVTGTSASFSYDLTDFTGTRYAGSHVTVDLWCPGSVICG